MRGPGLPCLLLAACAMADLQDDGGVGAADDPGRIDAAPASRPDGRPWPDAQVGADAMPAQAPPDARPVDAQVFPAGCTLLPQMGCAAGQACDLDPSVGTRCRVSGGGRETAACADPSECAAGFTCAGEGVARSCVALCRGHADCLAPGGRCLVALVLGGYPVAGTAGCTQSCDPVSSAGCPAGWGCQGDVDASAGDAVYSVCRPAGAGGQGDVCAAAEDCQPGHRCVLAGAATRRCARYCRAGGAECVGTGATCTPLAVPLVLGGLEYGVCKP